VYDRVAEQMRERVRTRQYIMTLHAEEEMDEDGLALGDVEHALLTGGIVERQRDRDTREWKYVVSGQSRAGDAIGVVGKLSPTGKLVIITVYVV